MNRAITFLILTFLLVVFLPSGAVAFGAGDIPDFAYLNNRAFRHGDIENILSQIAKGASMAGGGGGLLGFAKQVLEQASSGGNFDKGDIKKVYFGNWLRDYSQAMDIGGLSKLTADTLVLVVSVLGFMTFGFATEEFQVTAERLGVYLPVEHIDNPKGYAEKEGDARQFHPKLRPPVDPRELEIDERTGMKNYMATENQGWDTSTAHIRRTLRACIEHGRRAGGRDGADLWEAYRLLGTGMHTLEDFSAHSNWCEIALRRMGHEEVFCHVGEGTFIETPNGRAPPLVTGTFGGADFLHSLMGEATDHLSQSSVTALGEKMSQASQSDSGNIISSLKNILGKAGKDDKMAEGEDLEAKSKAYNFDPDNIAPPEVQQQLMALLRWRDGVYREVLEKIEMIPGLSDLIEELTNALNAYVYTVLAPWLTPILGQATDILGQGSKAVIDSDDQYEVFTSDTASDPSHSLLSKDHFGLILNEPAGKVAQVVVIHTAQLIVQAWSDNSDPDQVIDQILEAFHHPYYATGRSRIQHQMMEEMEKWLGGLGPDEARQVIEALTKENVRNGKNKRLDYEQNSGLVEPGYTGSQSQSGGYGAHESSRPSRGDHSNAYNTGNYGSEGSRNTYEQESQEYGRGSRTEYQGRSGYGEDSYDASRNTSGQDPSGEYGGRGEYRSNDDGYNQGRNNEYRRDDDRYGQTTRNDSSGDRYGRSDDAYSGRQEYESSGARYGQEDSYRSNRTETYSEEQSYGSRRSQGRDSESYGRNEGREYESGQQDSYSSRNTDSEGYGRTEGREYDSGQQDSYSSRNTDSEGYGRNEGREYEFGQQDSYSSRNTDSESYRRNEGREYSGYGSGRQESYSSRSRDSESYGRNEGREYDNGRQQESYRSESEADDSSYNPSYGGQDDTFGAERLNIGDEGYGSRRSRNEYDSGY